MRLIDADKLTETINKALETPCYNDYQDGYDTALNTLLDYIADMPTIPAYGQWIKTADRAPKLPDDDYCSVWVITYLVGDIGAYPMQYERAIVRGKQVERWRYCWDKLADFVPDYWMPLPEPPEEGHHEY